MRNVPSGRTMEDRLEYYSMPEPNSGCQLWFGAVNDSGYGVIGVGKSAKVKFAHRVSWEINRGAIPNGMMLCHLGVSVSLVSLIRSGKRRHAA